MHVFSTKLDDTRRTIELVLAQDCRPLSLACPPDSRTLLLPSALAVLRSRQSISVSAAEHSGAAPTLVQTPMEFVLADGGLVDTDVFLFSASGNNPDILAAQQTAIARGARSLHVVTNNGVGELAKACANVTHANVHVLPTADVKDGFLATHSLVSAITGILTASDVAAAGVPKATLPRTCSVQQIACSQPIAGGRCPNASRR